MNRASFRRILRLDEMVRLGRLHSAAQAAAELEVSVRTVERDIETLRDCHAEIEYDPRHRRYYYKDHSIMLPGQWLNEREIALILIAEKSLRVYAQAAFSDEVHPTFNRLLDPIRNQPETLEQIRELARCVCFYRSYEPTRGLRPLFQCVLDAMQSNRRLSVEYQGTRDRKPIRREIEPYVLVNNHGEWQVIGSCRRSHRIKTFALDRMYRPRLSEHAFMPPADFKPDKYYCHPFEPLDGSPLQGVVLRLEGGAAERAKQRLWHPSQTISRNRDRSVTFTMRCGLTPGLIRWILTLGADAEVIAPGKLREMVAAEARAVVAKYEVKVGGNEKSASALSRKQRCRIGG